MYPLATRMYPLPIDCMGKKEKKFFLLKKIKKRKLSSSKQASMGLSLKGLNLCFNIMNVKLCLLNQEIIRSEASYFLFFSFFSFFLFFFKSIGNFLSKSLEWIHSEPSGYIYARNIIFLILIIIFSFVIILIILFSPLKGGGVVRGGGDYVSTRLTYVSTLNWLYRKKRKKVFFS